MSIFDTLNKLSKKDNPVSDNMALNKSSVTEQPLPSYILLDENNEVKEKKISELLDSAGSAYINKVMNYNSLELIRDSIFQVIDCFKSSIS